MHRPKYVLSGAVDVSELLAARWWSTRVFDQLHRTVVSIGRRIAALDRALFERAARVGPQVDVALPVSRVADGALLWILVAAGMTASGRPGARRAAAHGLLTIAGTSLMANQLVKRALYRQRPDRLLVPEGRRAPARQSSSFPSGHTASAVAFGTVVGRRRPLLRWPLVVLAVAVGSSRVFTGLHYPTDVLGGAAIGALAGGISCRVAQR